MKNFILVFLLIGFFGACNQSSKSPESITKSVKDNSWQIKTGSIKMILIDGKYNVWTKQVGEGKIKVLLLNGGSEFTGDNFKCFEDFLPKEGIEIYYYDLLGTGNSDIPTDTTLWNTPRFVEEIEQVRKGLGLDNFYILGHFGGGMLTMEYLQKYQRHVKAVILSSMTAGMKSYTSYVEPVKKRLFTKQDIKNCDSLDRLREYDLRQCRDLLMNKLKTWGKLPNIKIPTLVIGGMFDKMNSEDMKKEGKLIPNSRTYLCPNGSHLSIYDDQQNYFTSLVSFLKEVEDNTFSPDKK